MNGIVLDASVALCWCFQNQMNPYATAVDAAGRAGLPMQSPSVWPLEIGQALLRAERAGQMTLDQVDRWSAIFRTTVVGTDRGGADLALERVLQLARSTGLSTYDASYVELALRLGWPLATLDAALRKAAQRAGVALFEPAP